MKKLISGKVREVYDNENGTLSIVTTDRISAFDVILPTMIEGKGEVLNSLSAFWCDYIKEIIPNHIVSTCKKDFPLELQKAEYEGRVMVVKKLKMIKYEVIVRGYMFGSLYNAYKKEGSFLGHSFKAGYKEAQKLDTPIVTPSTKAAEGHDINVSIEHMKKDLGEELGSKIERAALAIYNKCYDYAYSKGIIIADTKFEFGQDEKEALILADEVLTPDSSRFWDKNEYKEGVSPKSYDKQFVRDYLKENNLVGKVDAILPPDIVKKTQEIYKECKRKLCGR